MNRDELLTKLAMELDEWPKTTRDVPSGINAMWCFDRGSCPEESGVYAWATHNPDPDDDTINEYDWLARRTELINRPSWDDAPEWAQWLSQEASGHWCWHERKPYIDPTGWTMESPNNESHELATDGVHVASHDWRDTLEPRPQAQSKPQTCRHCDIAFNRPHVDGIPDDRCTRCDDEIKALWPDREPTKTWWTSKKCTECGHTTAAKVSDDKPVCPGCVALGPDVSDGGPDVSSGQYAKAPCGSDAESALSQAISEKGRTIEDVLSDWQAAHPEVMSRSKYHREVKPGVSSGGDNDYWLARIETPKRLEPYTAECEDLIEYFQMSFAEGNAFKALWRMGVDRVAQGKPGDTPLRNAQKVAYYGERMAVIEKAKELEE